MTTRKMLLTFIGLIVLVLLLLILWLFWFLLRSDKTPEVGIEIETSPIEETLQEPTLKEQQLKQEQNTRNQTAGVTSVAKMFTERYGSHSNEANFQNLIDVFPIMTDEFVQESKDMIAKTAISETYYGVTTSVLTVTVEKIDEAKGAATIRLNTQREIAKDSPQNISVENQEIVLELVRLEGVWKVASANWQ